MPQIVPTVDGMRLLYEGSLALARVEAVGLRVDEQYLASITKKVQKQIKEQEALIQQDKTIKVWKRRFGSKFNLQSRTQLGTVLAEELGVPLPKTQGGAFSTDAESLAMVDLPFVKSYLKVASLKKLLQTYIFGVTKHAQNGRIHSFYNLHTVRTYRSSSDSPNFQNQPKRDEEHAKIVRKLFIPDPGCVLMETDYKGIEVHSTAWYHKDPNMLAYLNDKSLDMHRDMAMECYKLPREDITAAIRHLGKNKFVFPSFYGDWFKSTARALWDASLLVTTASGAPLRKHLEEQGFTELGDCDPEQDSVPGTYEHHICRVEKRFWNKRFPTYAQWKKDWYNLYLERGWLTTYTGFVCQGFMKKNDTINYPPQGDAFHCLLQALIWLVRKDLPKRKLRTRVAGQIHDSLVSLVPTREIEDYKALQQEVMVTRLKKIWPFIITPIEIDVSMSEKSWADME